MNGLVPILKFPTTLIIIDDNPEFLNNIELILGDKYRYKSFKSAKEALVFIKDQEAALQDMIKKYLSISIEEPELPTPTAPAYSNVIKIHDIIYNPNRFALSSVIITDFAMPDMNGLELCEQLKNRLLKIIMLTGEAGYDLAVSGFNKKLIDQFVLKTDQNFFDQILEYAPQLETKLFAQISKSSVDSISGNTQDCIFYDPVFIKFFEDTIKKLNIVEYYLLDPSGSYLLVDEAGKISWLLVQGEADMQILEEVAYDHSRNDSDPRLQAIKSRKKLAFFFNPDEQLTDPESWRLEDAEVLEGKNTYYYSIVHGTNDYYSLEKEIVPYCYYLKN